MNGQAQWVVVSLVIFSLFCAGFYTKELNTQYSAVFICTLVPSQLVKKGPYENESNLSVGSGLFHWRALLTFYTAQHQKVSFIEWLRWLIFKLVHFVQRKPRNSFKTDTIPKTFQNTGVKFSLYFIILLVRLSISQLLNLNLGGSYLGKPLVTPPSCTKFRQPSYKAWMILLQSIAQLQSSPNLMQPSKQSRY